MKPSSILPSAFYVFIWKSGKFYASPGFIFGLGITLTFAQRFLIEFLKENQMPFEANLSLNMGQTLSIPLVLVGIFVTMRTLKSSPVNDGLKE